MISAGQRPGRHHFTVAKPDRRGMFGTMPVKLLKPDETSSEAPHDHGRRVRLRERFRGAEP
jgi:hypothetical protein